MLDQLAKSVNAEWPTLLAAQFGVMLLQFDRTVRRFPKWAEFAAENPGADLTVDQTAEAPALVQALGAGIAAADEDGVVDPDLPAALRALLPDGPDGAPPSPAEAADLLESANNTLKTLVEGPPGASGSISAWIKETARKSGAAFASHAQDSLVQQSAKLGDETGPAAGKLLKRLVKRAVWWGGGGLLLWRLIELFPDRFGWFEPFLRLLNH